MSTSKLAKNIFGFCQKALAGTPRDELNCADFSNNIVLIVNVASEWGLTKQNYEQLNVLYEKYSNQGFRILAQPSNQFGKQEPLSGLALWDHIKGKYNPLYDTFFDKCDVNGSNASELFLYLQNHPNCHGFLVNKIKWNFTKFLIGRDGVPIKRYGSKTAPLDIEKDIIEALNTGNSKN